MDFSNTIDILKILIDLQLSLELFKTILTIKRYVADVESRGFASFLLSHEMISRGNLTNESMILKLSPWLFY